jgi:hypothetical protein
MNRTVGGVVQVSGHHVAASDGGERYLSPVV